MRVKISLLIFPLLLLMTACDELPSNTGGGGNNSGGDIDGESARVIRVIDGDTIDVDINGTEYRVRYVGVNTPERGEACYDDAVNANRDLVQGETVTLVIDTSDTDQYDRLLRYIYVGNTFVNDELVRTGYAEAVRYAPDDEFYNDFLALEREAEQRNLGCHPTGIFDDGSDTR
jgi:endonuclease YncB( thermonuclease family)